MSETNNQREAFAAVAHESWSGWMRYLFDKSVANSDGTVTIPAWAVERWKRQMQTPYADLSEAEKQSDRAEADKYLSASSPFELERIGRVLLRYDGRAVATLKEEV